MKIRSVGAGLTHADGRTNGHDEAKGRFSQFSKAPTKENSFFPTRTQPPISFH
jgi:hypothetical protein